ncbi:universal stress protein [Chamaesiphon polymorphus]|uniref:Universal stress protein n=1 Tax=Chamaesiphon polymorphus CCALA 037 TaxID=2107692 RepID=A0A2T1GAW4_9CYAN|nr:universal stress protein [Chamaesiphon polymorphus]PSB54345.1 universal stress protein [Chamaesiphon polymorphus CCALA 037]
MFHKILVAIDGSDTSHDVFKTALDIAKADRANLVLLHVLSLEEQNNLILPMPIGMEYIPVADSNAQRIYRERWQTYEQQNLDLLKSLADRATAAGITTEFHQVAGSPGRKICEFAQSADVDLIVMGHRGISGLNELLVGSVSNYVLHHALCSVLMDKTRSI